MTDDTKLMQSLEFLSNEAEEDEGLGNAGIETYRDDPYASVAREVGQNSRDAGVTLPVRVSFDVLDIPIAELPAIDKLRDAVESCLKKAAESGDKKELAFFAQAKSRLQQDILKVLRISDANTTGLTGPAQPRTPFHSLVKGSGVSQKDSDSSGGSFGIGKNAAFAVSDIQAVFYSTLYEDAQTEVPTFLAQGKVVLISHTDKDGVPRRAQAYWGKAGFKPFGNPEEAPTWLHRDAIGTSVFAMGFRETSDWQSRMAYSLIQNFFHAIHEGEMEFSIDKGSIQITKATLPRLFVDEAIEEAARQNNAEDEFYLARSLYRCLTSPDAKEEVINIEELGAVTIRVLVEENLPKKVFILRNGMVITDSLVHFGDKLSHFPMYREFVALVIPKEKKGSAYIRWLESPRHDELSAERLPDPAKRDHAKIVMKRLAKRIRDVLKSYTLVEYDDEVSADEMAQYFPPNSGDPSDGAKSDNDDPETITYSVEPRRPRTDPGDSASGQGTGGGPRPGPRPGPGPGPGPRPGPQPRPQPGSGGQGNARVIYLADVRNIPGPNEDATKRAVFFTPAEGGMATIAIDATGLAVSERLSVIGASDADVRNGQVHRAIVVGERVRIDLQFSEPYKGPIELQAVVVPETGGGDEGQ